MDWLSRRNLLPWWQPAVDGKGSWPQRRFSSGPPLMDQSPDWHHPEYTAANKREEWLTDWKMKTGQATGGQWMVYRRSPHSKANCRYIQNIQKQNRDDLFSFRILELHTHTCTHTRTQSTHRAHTSCSDLTQKSWTVLAAFFATATERFGSTDATFSSLQTNKQIY